MDAEPRLWQHDRLWRIQDHRQLTTRNGVQDAWESRRDEHGHVMLFETEEQAKKHLESGEKKP